MGLSIHGIGALCKPGKMLTFLVRFVEQTLAFWAFGGANMWLLIIILKLLQAVPQSDG